MLSKSKTTKALLYSTAALSLFAASHVHADETSHWTARSVDQIKADISVNDNQQTYTVQYGDTLGSIVEAMGIDMNVLANIKEITNIDLIFPGTVLTTTYNADNQAVSVKVETPSSETSDTPVVAESNLTTNEVTVNGQSVVVSDLSAPVETVNLTATQAPAKDESTQVVSEVTEAIASDAPAYADTEQPVADAIDHHVTSSTKATEAPATETSAPASEAPVNETPVATSEAPVNETPVATSDATVNETPVATSYATVNETPVATEEAPVNETPVATEAQPAAPVSEAPVNETSVVTEEAQPAAPVSEAPVNETSVVTEEAQPEPEPVLEAPVNETSVVTEEAQPAVLEVQPESTPNTYPVGQCTWGVKSLAPWAGNYWGNAKDWIASAQAAGHSVGTTPVAGAIAVWPNEGGGYGHVAYVTSASDEHSIQVMESNYAGNMSIGNYRGTFDPTAAWWGGSVYYIYP
ncbi:CHAP domain-containing protein [Streptococcus thermophilus]|uniref:COG3942 and LysM peptidoglycan-binding domain-containing protein n=1 Tax=Streptococcus thermophilus TaxID=1308 RepID=UPI001C65353E|nr:CHAP domain-containing protein [Streptococcus thermophilus]MBW7827010.1 CHAP domain-containing protein [Streptococcus thermophilus]